MLRDDLEQWDGDGVGRVQGGGYRPELPGGPNLITRAIADSDAWIVCKEWGLQEIRTVSKEKATSGVGFYQ